MKTIHLPMINLTPTMRCNLRCRLCGVLVPQYSYRPQMSIHELSHTLSAVFEIVDTVEKLQITGGEPFLHDGLPEIIRECFQYSRRFSELWLFTNCAVPISSELAEVMEEYKSKILIHASDYGVNPSVSEGVVAKLKNMGCRYRYLKYFGEDQYLKGWVDQGDFNAHHRPADENMAVFSSCAQIQRGGSWYVRGGQMHWCGRSIRGTEVEKVPLREEDYLDIFKGTVDERKTKLEKLSRVQYIAACDYCNGEYGTRDESKRHRAGEQVL